MDVQILDLYVQILDSVVHILDLHVHIQDLDIRIPDFRQGPAEIRTFISQYWTQLRSLKKFRYLTKLMRFLSLVRSVVLLVRVMDLKERRGLLHGNMFALMRTQMVAVKSRDVPKHANRGFWDHRPQCKKNVKTIPPRSGNEIQKKCKQNVPPGPICIPNLDCVKKIN